MAYNLRMDKRETSESVSFKDQVFKDIISKTLDIQLSQINIEQGGKTLLEEENGHLAFRDEKFILIVNSSLFDILKFLSVNLQETEYREREKDSYKVTGRTGIGWKISTQILSDPSCFYEKEPGTVTFEPDFVEFSNNIKQDKIENKKQPVPSSTTAVLAGNTEKCTFLYSWLKQENSWLKQENGLYDFWSDSNLNFIEIRNSNDRESRHEEIHLIHEAVSFVSNNYLHLIGYIDQQENNCSIEIWSDGIPRAPIENVSAFKHCTKNEDMKQALLAYLCYFRESSKSSKKTLKKLRKLRTLIVRQMRSGSHDHLVREFILCSSIERWITLITPKSKETEEKKKFDTIKDELLKCLESYKVRKGFRDDKLIQSNIERFEKRIESTDFLNVQEKFRLFFAQESIEGVDWDKYKEAWSKIRNPVAHGREPEFNQQRIKYYLLLIELWYLLIFTELGCSVSLKKYRLSDAKYS